LQEEAGKWFELNVRSPYMLLVAKVKKEKLREISNTEQKLFGIDRLNISRSQIPAVTHVDYTARVQTVSSEQNELFYTLLQKFNELTGCPVLVNTSFNVRGEPIVCTPEDAFRCFMGTDLDILVVGNLVAIKGMQTVKRELYKQKFEAD
jgi:carbamoyltransferase